MGRKGKKLRLSLCQIPRSAVKCVESVGVKNDWKRRLADKRGNETLRFLVRPNPGADGKKSLALHKGAQTTGFAIRRGNRAYFGGSKRLGHDFRLRRSDHGKNHIRRCDSDQPGAGTKRAAASQNCSPGLAQRPGEDQNMTKLAFVRIRLPDQRKLAEFPRLNPANLALA